MSRQGVDSIGVVVWVGAGGAVVGMGVGKDTGVGVGTDVSVDASVGVEVWMRVRASVDVGSVIALCNL